LLGDIKDKGGVEGRRDRGRPRRRKREKDAAEADVNGEEKDDVEVEENDVFRWSTVMRLSSFSIMTKGNSSGRFMTLLLLPHA
jgi:hypothetical protein